MVNYFDHHLEFDGTEKTNISNSTERKNQQINNINNISITTLQQYSLMKEW